MTADAVGGVWRYAMDLGTALASRGIRLTVAVMGPLPRPWQALEAERRGIALVSRPYRLEWMDEPWDDVRRAGQWLLALERTIAPDVVHLNGYSHAALPWHVPPIVVAHSCVCSWWRAVKGERAPQQWDTYRAAVMRGLAAAHAVVTPTVAMREALEQEYGPCPHARVVPNALADVMDAGGAPAVTHGKEHAIFAAGRLWDEAKNIGAVCSVAREMPWPVWIAGETRTGDDPCQEFGVARHLGRLPREEMSEWYARAAIYALPALYEPFGLSILEAARAGCALVVGDIPSLRENWDGAAAFVPPRDRGALLDVLRALIAQPHLRARLSALARERSRAFRIDEMTDAYVSVYGGIQQGARSSA